MACNDLNCWFSFILGIMLMYCLVLLLIYDENPDTLHTTNMRLDSHFDWQFVHGYLIPGFVIAKYAGLSLERCNLSSIICIEKGIETLKKATLDLHATSFTSHGHIKIQLKPSEYWVKKWDLSIGTKYFGTYYLKNTLGPWCYMNDTKCIESVSLNNQFTNKIISNHTLNINKTNCSNDDKQICIPSKLVPNIKHQQIILERMISGSKYAKQNIKMVIGMLLKDVNISKLNHIYHLLRMLTDLLLDFRVIFIENDSNTTYGTTKRLREICNNNTQYICLNGIFHLGNQLKQYGTYSKIRIKTMAFLRNLILEYVQTYYNKWEYLLMIDADEIVAYNEYNYKQTVWPYTVMNSFYGESSIFDENHVNGQWDALCANGMLSDLKMWDTFPFVAKFVDLEFINIDWDIHPGSNNRPNWCQMAQKYDVEFIPVNSCFGPYTIYKIKSLKTCKYYFLSERTSEHVTIHNCLARNDKTVYINPYMFAYARQEYEAVKDNDVCICSEL